MRNVDIVYVHNFFSAVNITSDVNRHSPLIVNFVAYITFLTRLGAFMVTELNKISSGSKPCQLLAEALCFRDRLNLHHPGMKCWAPAHCILIVNFPVYVTLLIRLQAFTVTELSKIFLGNKPCHNRHVLFLKNIVSGSLFLLTYSYYLFLQRSFIVGHTCASISNQIAVTKLN
jgi:hypothetical protein